MKCSEFRVRLDQLLDNRLDPEMDWNLTSHAERCEACRDELSGQQLLNEAMALYDIPDLGDTFAEEVVVAALRRPQPTRVRQSKAWWFAGVAIAASLLVAFNFLSSESWHNDANDHVGAMHANPIQLTADSSAVSPEPNAVSNLAGKTGAGKVDGEGPSTQSIIQSGSDLFSLQGIDSYEIPGVRPLKTSLDVTISLLKQTIPGHGSAPPKQPTTSQIVNQNWYPV